MPNNLREALQTIRARKDQKLAKNELVGIISSEVDRIATRLEAVSRQIQALPRQKDGRTPVAGVDFPFPKDGEPGKDGSPDTGKEIVKKVNELPIDPKLQIDAKHIKNLPRPLFGLSRSAHLGGVKLETEVVLDGAVNGTNAVFTVPSSKPTPKAGRVKLFMNGVRMQGGGVDYTHSSRTFTMNTAPPSGGQAPIIDYEAE